MNMITRFDPFRETTALQNTLDRWFCNPDFGRVANEELMTAGEFVPPVDIYEDDHNINLKLEVPGIEQKDLDIRLEENTLTVKGERKFAKEEKEENFHRIERRYGSFYRSFTLPNKVDPEKVFADYKDGVLHITLVKKAEAKPKQIRVTVGAQPKEVRAA